MSFTGWNSRVTCNKKVYITVKVIICRSRGKNFFGEFDLIVSACKRLNAKLTLFARLNYLPSCSHVRTNNLHNVNQWVLDYKSVWGFFDIPIGCRENLFWSWWIKSLRIFVNWERIKRKIFGISKKPHTLLRIDNQGTFWPNFIRIRQIYIPC